MEADVDAGQGEGGEVEIRQETVTDPGWRGLYQDAGVKVGPESAGVLRLTGLPDP